jgi:hypothetical protein
MGSARSDQQDAGGQMPALPVVELWLVDGFNTLHAVLLGGEPREQWWRAEQRQRLIDRAAAFRDVDARIRIAFDGSRPADDVRADERVAVVFAPSADDWLVEQVRAAPHPERIAVVTGDRRVSGRCRHAGASVVTPAAFLAHCGPGAQSDVEAEARGDAPAEAR